MIDISCKFHLQKNDVIYTYCINLVEAIIRHQQLPLTCKELPTSSFIPCKNQRKLLTSGVIFTVNTYECFMENKNMIKHSAVVNLQNIVVHEIAPQFSSTMDKLVNRVSIHQNFGNFM